MNYRNEKNDELHYNEVCRTYRLFLDGGGDIGSRENREYDAAVADAIEYFGGEENAPVWADMDTAEVFANVYKSDMGFRPRGWMLAAARAWLDARPELGYDDDGEEIFEAPIAEYSQPHKGEPLGKSWLYDLI
jgi:hypothetical protein